MNENNFLKKLSEIKVGHILPFDINSSKNFILDLTSNNQELATIDLDSEEFTDYILNKADTGVAIGQYNENRTIYNRSELFSGEARTIHLGIDLFIKENTPIYSILDGSVHSFNDNDNFGDYGPTIILEHTIDRFKFFTLYGHLTRESLNGLEKGKLIKKGERLAEIGSRKVNGDWPPHVHFQIILDMLDKEGDFFGVASKQDREKFLEICPNPNLLLRINELS